MKETKSIEEVSDSVLKEVLRARQMWGTSFDEKNTLNDWAAYVNIYFGRATAMGVSADDVRTNLRKAAGLVLSALFQAENNSLALRHYDSQPRPESLPEIGEN
jgi:hypothetical protein